jgi:lipopolysaccharide O-acetyltransferase
MKLLFFILSFIITVPARLKGMKIGKNSFIGPGYDFIETNLKGITIGDNVVIGRNAWLQTASGNVKQIIEIGDNTRVGRSSTISANKNIRIGKNCMISYNVSILDHDHSFQNLSKTLLSSGLTKGKEIVIEDDCFIGAHTFILKGVHLGKRCVVGANSVVTKSFPAFSIIAGSPAILVKKNRK